MLGAATGTDVGSVYLSTPNLSNFPGKMGTIKDSFFTESVGNKLEMCAQHTH